MNDPSGSCTLIKTRVETYRIIFEVLDDLAQQVQSLVWLETTFYRQEIEEATRFGRRETS